VANLVPAYCLMHRSGSSLAILCGDPRTICRIDDGCDILVRPRGLLGHAAGGQALHDDAARGKHLLEAPPGFANRGWRLADFAGFPILSIRLALWSLVFSVLFGRSWTEIGLKRFPLSCACADPRTSLPLQLSREWAAEFSDMTRRLVFRHRQPP